MITMGRAETGQANGIHYVIQGSGPHVTLSHALGCDYTMWEPQMAALLDAGYRVLRFDTRGHGQSDAPPGSYGLEGLAEDLLGLLSKLNAGPTHFVGLSLGGMLGQAFALKYPTMFKSLVLCNTMSHSPTTAAALWEERLRVAQTAGMDSLVEPTLARWFTPSFQEGRPDRIEPIARVLRGTSVLGYVGCARAILAADLAPRFSGIATPSLVVAGEDDPTISLTRELHDALSCSELAVIPKASHLSNVEQPERFNAVLLDFLRRLTQRGLAF